MIDQILISLLFFGLLAGLIFSNWAASKIFVGAMLAAYFLGLVET